MNQKRKTYLAVGLCAALYIAAVTAYTIWSNESRKSLIMEEIDAKLLIAAKSIKYILPEDFHDRALSPNSISFTEELNNRRIMNRFTEENGFKWTYTLAEREGKFYFSAPTVTAEEAKERKVWYFYPYDDIPPEFARAFKELKIHFVEYTDQWGTFRSVALPQLSPEGRVYLSCADYEISYLKSILRENLATSILSAIYFIIFSLPFIFIFRSFYRSYSRRLKTINDELVMHKTNLEGLVEKRTEELSKTNEMLQTELKTREKIEEILRDEKKKLEDALSEVKTLSGLLPICASCKKIRDDSGYWNQIEQYIQKHSGATFSHGLCPECAKKLYPGLMEKE
ncbi:MAG TPA: hypothetical protein PK358_10510 [Spirochaetota bacterium]|nr:hypothetical protein [Spirochaetota bacterium]HPJ35258.1 hypothetical protein [Spirochaetota bacterium]